LDKKFGRDVSGQGSAGQGRAGQAGRLPMTGKEGHV